MKINWSNVFAYLAILVIALVYVGGGKEEEEDM